MAMRLAIVIIGLAVTMAPQPTTQKDEVLEKVKKQLLDMVSKHKSFSAKITMKVDFSGTASWDRVDGNGTVEYLIQGDEILSRAEVTSDSISTIGATEIKTRDVHTMYGDGKIVYDVGETNGAKMAFKLKADPMQIAVPTKAFFDVVREQYEAKLLPDETIDGKTVWAIETKPNEPEKMPAARTVSYFRKDIPLMVKTVSYDKYNKLFQTTLLTDIKVDQKHDPERFVFKRPPDVELYDDTDKK